MRAKTLPSLGLICALLVSLLATPTALADRSYRTEMRMAESKRYFPSVSVGHHIYTFGGWGVPGVDGGFIDTISRVNTASGTTEVLDAKLPTHTRGAAAFYDGEHIWILGGRDSSGYLDSILRYDPRADIIETLPNKLPFKDELLTAVWTGKYAYIVGGWYGSLEGRIARFDPRTGVAESTGVWGGGTGAVYDGERYIYMPGLNYDGPNPIRRFDTVTNEVRVMDATLPYGWGVSAVWADSAMYVFGGNVYFGGGFRDFYPTIARYDPSTDTTSVMDAELPSGRAHSSAISTPYGIYVLGGAGYHPTLDWADFWTCGDSWCLSELDEVVGYDPTPSAPGEVSAIPSSTTPGAIELSWTAPQRNSYGTALISYKIYRSDASGESLIATFSADQTSYTDTGCLGICAYSIAATNATGEGPKSTPVISAGAGT